MRSGFREFKTGFDSLKNGKPLSKSEKYVDELLEDYEQSCAKRDVLLNLGNKYIGKEKELCEEAYSDLVQVSNEEKSVGKMLIKIAENQYTFKNEGSRKYWARVLCEAASEIEDVPGLLAITKSTELAVAHTAARKAFRTIDFVNYGPKIE